MDTILASPKEESRRTFHSGEKQVWDSHSDLSSHLRKMASPVPGYRREGNPKGNPLPPNQMPQPPIAHNNNIANQDYQADRKEARDQIKERENDLAVMRTNIVATTDEKWLRWIETAQETRQRFENFSIIAILRDHKTWYENDPNEGVAGAAMTVKKISQIQNEYLDFSQQQHTSILTHYENFRAI